MTKVYIPENFDSRDRPPSKPLIDESVLQSVENSENLEDIQFCHLMTVEAQSQSPQALEFDDSLMTVDDSDDSSRLNSSETELLEYLQKAVAENDPYFAQQVRGILTEVCKAGAADRKKVWGALGDAEQKKFSELVKVEIPAKVGHIIEAILQILPTEDPNEIDHLFRVFAPELISEAIELLRPADKTTILHWIEIGDLATDLFEAVFDGTVAEVAAANSKDLVELAIARLEYLKEWDAIEEIRDALG